MEVTMRSLLILSIAIAGCARAAEATPSKPEPVIHINATLSQDDLRNLVVCARLALKDLTPEQMAVVVLAIKHAEQDAPTQASRMAESAPAADEKTEAKK
jgi:hypothetical protein